MKTKFMKAIALCLALVLCFGSAISVSAAEVADAPIDESQKGSLTIFKYDLTNSENDGVWDSSYVSTGVADENGVGDVLADYALEGVEFSFVKVADVVQFTESTADNRIDNHVEVLYAIDKVQGADFLKALGLENGASCYENADQMDTSKYFYQSDVLIHALSTALTANSTVVKNAMEAYIAAIGATAMPLTDSFGKTKAENLTLGLYLIVETKVPENVVSTTDPFLISLPMTSVNGTNATDGGTRWIYDVTVYPKNQTGDPTLEKTLRESKSNTGKNNGTSSITDGFAHTGTASGGDTVEYQIISTLPAITSESTYLTTYTFVDTLSKGLTYAKGDVVLEFFTDVACTDSVAKWTEADGKFSVAYNSVETGETMTISMTQTGLTEINTSKAVYSAANMVNSGYSDLTLRITYAAKLDSDNSVAYGDDGNPNDVVLTWKRTSTDYSDTLVDDCHLYTYGIDLTKKFSDSNGDFSKHFTEDLLLSSMETAGAKDMPEDAERKGLGTPATRAGILEKLVSTGMLERRKVKKQTILVPTALGNSLITVLPEQLQSPLLTAEWEHRLSQVQKGELEPEEFLAGIQGMLTDLVADYRPVSGADILFPSAENTVGKCPRCGRPVIERSKGYFCTGQDCKFVLWRDSRFFTLKQKTLDRKTAQLLLEKGCASLKGCVSSKTGNVYDAAVVLEDDGERAHFKLVFGNG